MSVEETLAERNQTHGDFLEQAKTAQMLKQVLRNTPNWKSMVLDQRESLESSMTKISRICHGNHNEPDHWFDLSGYAQLIWSRLLRAKELKDGL